MVRRFLHIAVLLLACAAGCAQERGDSHAWRTYTNARYQYSVCYPSDLLIAQPEADNSDGRRFLAKDGAELAVFGRNNVLEKSLKTTLADTAARLAGPAGKTTYQAMRANWFVVSGENGDRIFYAKAFLSHEQYKVFELTYDRAHAAMYKPVVTKLAACFKDGER